MEFGQALDLMRAGRRVSRKGWNGKGMWVCLVPLEVAERATRMFGYEAELCIMMKTANNTLQLGWLASQADLFAYDWQVEPEDRCG